MTGRENVGPQPVLGLVDPATTDPKPWLFLDCDGVVSPLPPRDHEERERVGVPPGYFTCTGAFWVPYFHEHIRDWIGQLDHAFDIIWSSSWEEEMLWALVGTPLGFSRWPSIEARSFTARTRADYKAKAVRAHLDRHPRPIRMGRRRPQAWPTEQGHRRAAARTSTVQPEPLHRPDPRARQAAPEIRGTGSRPPRPRALTGARRDISAHPHVAAVDGYQPSGVPRSYGRRSGDAATRSVRGFGGRSCRSVQSRRPSTAS
jgi:hypothetical protein